MHLINVHTFKLHEFYGSRIPSRYAVLSHTWGEEEVSFQEFQSGDLSVRAKRGFAKVFYTCNEAKRMGLDWAWVDTCCIDKSSSAELSEAINSMYAWYENSDICFAYLDDVPDNDRRSTKNHDHFRRSRWFSRGWTLQELIAPRQVNFYSDGWALLGNRYSLSSTIRGITRIPTEVLGRSGGGKAKLDSYSIAQRMSWAADRQTTREEDIAYCLLGIFHINMPLLYGEGPRAFQRLQEEIIKQTDDHTLFAWPVTVLDDAAWSLGGVLARSPANFSGCSTLRVIHKEVGQPSLMTKKGLQIDAPIVPLEFPDTTRLHNYGASSVYSLRDLGPQLFQVVLNCRDADSRRTVLWVLRENQGKEIEGQLFHRVMVPGIQARLWRVDDEFTPDPFFVRNAYFHQIYISATGDTDSPFVGGGIHFHGIPLIFHTGSEWAEPLWTRGWSLLARPRLRKFWRPVLDTDVDHKKYRRFRNQHFDWPFRPCGTNLPIHTADWHESMWDRTTMDCFTLVGDPEWDEYPALICGTVLPIEGGDIRCDSDVGLYCCLVSEPPSVIKGGQFDLEIIRDSAPLVFYPNGNSGKLFFVEAKCAETIINVMVYREQGHEHETLDLDSGVSKIKPHFLFIFRQFSTEAIPDESYFWEDHHRPPWNVDNGHGAKARLGFTDLEAASRNSVISANGTLCLSFDEMDRVRRRLATERQTADTQRRQLGKKLEWCRIFTFEGEDHNSPTLCWERKYCRDASDSDDGAVASESAAPVVSPPPSRASHSWRNMVLQTWGNRGHKSHLMPPASLDVIP